MSISNESGLDGQLAPLILVHGGAGNVEPSREGEVISCVTDAAAAGYKVLMSGGSAVDAVEAAIQYVITCLEKNVS